MITFWRKSPIHQLIHLVDNQCDPYVTIEHAGEDLLAVRVLSPSQSLKTHLEKKCKQQIRYLDWCVPGTLIFK